MLPILWNDSALPPMSGGPINRLTSLFDRVIGEDTPFGETWGGVPIAVWDDGDHIFVEAEVPGMTNKDVDITVQGAKLFIRGERKDDEGRTYLYNGRCYGRFERVITLPEAIVTDAVQAELQDGVLSITLPKSPEAKPRKIALKTS
jgi:HSP20 family protein